jgi:hypothetical protein
MIVNDAFEWDKVTNHTLFEGGVCVYVQGE